MSNQFLTINETELVPLQTVKRIRPVTDEDRQSLAKLGRRVDASKFSSKIEFADGRRNYVTESIDDLRDQTRLLEIGTDSYVVSANVLKARDLTDLDRTKMSERMNKPLSSEFSSQIDLTAGRVLSSYSAMEIMNSLN